MARRIRSKSRRSTTVVGFDPAKFWFLALLAAVAVIIFALFSSTQKTVSPITSRSKVEGASSNGFDQYGYNDTARLFNGTGASWCLAKGLPATCMGIYSPDKLVMKWNAEWDRGNAENWATPPYRAWIDNEWNGKNGGSGAVWHYKIVWVGACGADYTPLPDGGYCIWGQFATIMDQGVDPSLGPAHTWLAKAKPAGYGAFIKP